jgi:hypothetical protein
MPLIGMELRHRGLWYGLGLPAGDGSGMRTRFGIVGDPGEQAPHLDRGRQLAFLLKDGPNCCGLGFSDDEHKRNLGASAAASKL